MIQLEKREKFGGGKGGCERISYHYEYISPQHIYSGRRSTEIEQYKVVTLHRYLMGRARQELNPAGKTIYELATAVLRQRFPALNHETARLGSRNRAIAEMNSLTQGNMTSEEYVEKAQELYAKLRNEYA